jgi:chromosome segregation ATPase
MPLTSLDVNALPPKRAAPATKVVASRYATSTSLKAGGLPSVRSQMETAKAAASAAAAAEAEAVSSLEVSRRSAGVMRECMKASLFDVDSELCAVLADLDRANRRADALQSIVQERDSTIAAMSADATAAMAAAAESNERENALEFKLQAARANAEELRASAKVAHETVVSARDVHLPAAARRTEEQRARAERAEAQAAHFLKQLDLCRKKLAEGLSHFDALQRSIQPANKPAVDALAQEALASFGVLYAEKRLHAEPQFVELQDVLVRLCMQAGELTSWLPWWLAARRADMDSSLQELDHELGSTPGRNHSMTHSALSSIHACIPSGFDGSGMDALSPEAALSPELAISGNVVPLL